MPATREGEGKWTPVQRLKSLPLPVWKSFYRQRKGLEHSQLWLSSWNRSSVISIVSGSQFQNQFVGISLRLILRIVVALWWLQSGHHAVNLSLEEVSVSMTAHRTRLRILSKWSRSSCPTLCDPMDCSLPGFSVHGIFQARVLEWVAISFSTAYYGIPQKGTKGPLLCLVTTLFLFSLLQQFSFVFACSHVSDYTYSLAKAFPQTKGRQRTWGSRTIGFCSDLIWYVMIPLIFYKHVCTLCSAITLYFCTSLFKWEKLFCLFCY